MLFGTSSPMHRRMGGSLMLEVANAVTADVDLVRFTMAGAPSDFTPPTVLEETAARWRKLQVRQLFRLTLETLFSWILRQLGDHFAVSSQLNADSIAAQRIRSLGRGMCVGQWPAIARRSPMGSA